MKIVVWVSAGAASMAALILTRQQYPDALIRAVYNPVIEEHSDNLRFLKDGGLRCNIEIEQAKNFAWPDNSADTVWRKRGYMNGPKGAPCTTQLKKEARRTWEDLNDPEGEYYHVMGFTVGEEHRHERRVKAGMKILPILIEAGITKDRCFEIVNEMGIKLPEIYSIGSRFGSGFPNANCIGCVKASSSTYWNHVRETFPEVFEARAKLSREISKKGAKLVWYKGKRIFLDELPPDARGRSMKTMKIECGISCGIED